MRKSQPALGGTAIGRLLLVVAVAATGASCFNGADALGLPCNADDDCGEDQRCVEGICGGPQPTTTASSSGGNSSSTGGGSTSDSGSESSEDSTTGSIPVCGNRIVEDGEQCDPGPENDESCDSDCTFAVCGDGFVNEAAEEQCDDGNRESLDECSEECLETLFWDDMEAPVESLAKWEREQPEHTFMGSSFSLPSGWELGVPGNPGAGVWHSGSYHSTAGTARLSTVPIAFPALPKGYHYEVQFEQTIRFDGNPVDYMIGGSCGDPSTNDGGVVWLQPVAGGNPPILLGPETGSGVALTDTGTCADIDDNPNPFFVQKPQPRVYSGILGPMPIEQELPIDVGPGTLARVVFEVSYDCFNCWEDSPPGSQPPPGWVLDNVVVLPVPDR